MDKITVISADKDGADLRRERYRNPRYLRCNGQSDDGEINEALSSVGKRVWGGLGDDWERIFRNNRCL